MQQLLLEYTIEDIEKIFGQWAQKNDIDLEKLLKKIEDNFGQKLPFFVIVKIITIVKNELNKIESNQSLEIELYTILYDSVFTTKSLEILPKFIEIKNNKQEKKLSEKSKSVLNSFTQIKTTLDYMKFINDFNEIVLEEINRIKREKLVPIFSDSKFRYYKINSYEEIEILGKGTTWCVTNKDWYTKYNAYDLYVIIPHNPRKYMYQDTMISEKYLFAKIKNNYFHVLEDFVDLFKKYVDKYRNYDVTKRLRENLVTTIDKLNTISDNVPTINDKFSNLYINENTNPFDFYYDAYLNVVEIIKESEHFANYIFKTNEIGGILTGESIKLNLDQALENIVVDSVDELVELNKLLFGIQEKDFDYILDFIDDFNYLKLDNDDVDAALSIDIDDEVYMTLSDVREELREEEDIFEFADNLANSNFFNVLEFADENQTVKATNLEELKKSCDKEILNYFSDYIDRIKKLKYEFDIFFSDVDLLNAEVEIYSINNFTFEEVFEYISDNVNANNAMKDIIRIIVSAISKNLESDIKYVCKIYNKQMISHFINNYCIIQNNIIQVGKNIENIFMINKYYEYCYETLISDLYKGKYIENIVDNMDSTLFENIKTTDVKVEHSDYKIAGIATNFISEIGDRL